MKHTNNCTYSDFEAQHKAISMEMFKFNLESGKDKIKTHIRNPK